MEKKRIAVFDFDAGAGGEVAAAIREWFGPQGAVTQHRDMQQFAHDFKARQGSALPYDMVFISVDNMLGVETARNVREIDNWCPMFLVSSVGDFGMEGFRLHALDYLTKPVSPARIGQAVARIGMPCQAGAQWP